MIGHLLLIIGTYLLGMLAVHAANGRSGSSREAVSSAHLVLHTHNDSHHLEWALRSLTLHAWLRGQPLAITVRDAGSTDDTRQILQLFARRHTTLRIQTTPPISTFQNNTNEPVLIASTDSPDIHIRLGVPEDWGKLPYLL